MLIASVPATISAKPVPDFGVRRSPNTIQAKRNGNKDGKLVYLHHNTYLTCRNRVIEEQPRNTCGNARCRRGDCLTPAHQRGALATAFPCLPQIRPCHHQHKTGANGGCQVRFNALDTHLCQHRSKGSEHRCQQGIHQPGTALLAPKLPASSRSS